MQIIRDERCRQAANIDEAHVPRPLRFEPPLSTAARIAAGATMPYVLRANESMHFGGATHYDNSCLGTFSVQWAGNKHWWFWAPWDVGGLRSQSRFEGVVKPGELVIYGPAWHHGTEVLPGGGRSVAAAYYIMDVPFFGVNRNGGPRTEPL